MRCDLGQWFEHEATLCETRVRNDEIVTLDRDVAELDDVDVEGAWTPPNHPLAHGFGFDPLAPTQQGERIERRLDLDDHVQIGPLIVGPTDRIGLVHTRHRRDVAQAADAETEVRLTIAEVGTEGHVGGVDRVGRQIGVRTSAANPHRRARGVDGDRWPQLGQLDIDRIDPIEAQHLGGETRDEPLQQDVLRFLDGGDHPVGDEAVVHGVAEFVRVTCVAQVDVERQVDLQRLRDLTFVWERSDDGDGAQAPDVDPVTHWRPVWPTPGVFPRSSPGVHIRGDAERRETTCENDGMSTPDDTPTFPTNGRIDLTGRTFVITGGNGGIGLGMAEGIVQAGGSVSIWGRNDDKNAAALDGLQRLAAEAGSDATITARACDVGSEDAVVDATGATVGDHGRLDGLFANAGRGGTGTPFLELSLDEWRAVMDVNLDGVFLTLREAAKVMVAQGDGGSLVAVSSTSAVHGAAGNEAYGTAKTALNGLVRALAVGLARHGIRVNSLLPGWTITDLASGGYENDVFRNATTKRTPVRRWAYPSEFRAVGAFLADPSQTYHTGQEICVDGGYTVY